MLDEAPDQPQPHAPARPDFLEYTPEAFKLRMTLLPPERIMFIEALLAESAHCAEPIDYKDPQSGLAFLSLRIAKWRFFFTRRDEQTIRIHLIKEVGGRPSHDDDDRPPPGGGGGKRSWVWSLIRLVIKVAAGRYLADELLTESPGEKHRYFGTRAEGTKRAYRPRPVWIRVFTTKSDLSKVGAAMRMNRTHLKSNPFAIYFPLESLDHCENIPNYAFTLNTPNLTQLEFRPPYITRPYRWLHPRLILESLSIELTPSNSRRFPTNNSAPSRINA
ncbi:hypothetical protein [Kinneretia aquatilis]|uniref:hypothetical protein n=1 Tax=Kinneretia aquatilis TaxID=2070761 RepID=UPI001495250F|nr:hypothetical protein [Paucibacter aquatile]WIV98449.1 hypothetical protein K9V56_002750 [Paucibacter aquatile]